MKKKNKIIFAAQDPGGFNAIWPVIKKLEKSKRFNLITILANQSRQFAEKEKIKYLDADRLSSIELKEIIEREKPDLVFTATSFGPSIEKKLLAIAKNKKIPTLSIIDFWSNYNLRFKGINKPDYILVIDEIMKKEMIEMGFEPQKIFVVGNPFFDTFSKPKRYKERDLITFFSQPYSESFKRNNTEIQALKDLVKVLEKLQPKTPLIIKFHPRAKKRNKFDKMIKKSKLNIFINDNLSTEDLIKKSKLITGINSMVLFQAAMMGKKVLSYQPNSKIDYLVSNRLGLSQPVYKREDLEPVLKKLLSSQRKINLKLIEKYTQNNSTQKVISFIKMSDKKIICIIQARSGSKRLPNKVLLDLEGKPVLSRVIDRVFKSKKIDQIVVAATRNKNDKKIVDLIENYHPKVAIFCGSEEDVLDRYYQAAKKFKADIIVRITSDCPLVDPEIIDKTIKLLLKNNLDYSANIFKKRTYPRGLDVEVFSFKTLERIWKKAKDKEDREHVTLYLRKNSDLFKYKNIVNRINYSFHRWTIDEKDDYKLIKIIYRELESENPNFKMKDVINLFNKKPKLIKINQNVEQKKSQF